MLIDDIVLLFATLLNYMTKVSFTSSCRHIEFGKVDSEKKISNFIKGPRIIYRIPILSLGLLPVKTEDIRN